MKIRLIALLLLSACFVGCCGDDRPKVYIPVDYRISSHHRNGFVNVQAIDKYGIIKTIVYGTDIETAFRVRDRLISELKEQPKTEGEYDGF